MLLPNTYIQIVLLIQFHLGMSGGGIDLDEVPFLRDEHQLAFGRIKFEMISTMNKKIDLSYFYKST